MLQLKTPENLKLCDDITGREATRLCITFDTVPDATDYFVWVNNTEWPVSIQPGSWIDSLDCNSAYTLQVKARASGFDDSNLSTAYFTVTRPPTPSAPARLPFDLQGWGIVMQWAEPDGWKDSLAASVRLLRRDDYGSSVLLVERIGLSGRFVDTGYPFGVTKEYSLQVVTPSSLLGLNESMIGLPTPAIGSLGLVATSALPPRIEAAKNASERLAHRLMGLPL